MSFLAHQDPGNPWFSWQYVRDNSDTILAALREHVVLTAESVAIAAAIARAPNFRFRLARGHQGLPDSVCGTPAPAGFERPMVEDRSYPIQPFPARSGPGRVE